MKVLCIDDTPDILGILSLSLKLRWPDAEVLSAGDGYSGLDLFEREAPDLVVVDLGMPGMDGYEVIRQIRLGSDVPIVVLTVRDGDLDIAKALEMGADDYITKPFSHVELVARLHAALRRARPRNGSIEDSIEVNGLRLVPNTGQVFVGDNPVALTGIEYSLLYQLARNAGKVQTHETLLRKVWGNDLIGERRQLAVQISLLRTKLGDDSQAPKTIVTERGVGYRLVQNHQIQPEVTHVAASAPKAT